MSKDKGEPQSGLTYMVLGLIGIGLIALFNHTLLAEVHGKYFDWLYPHKLWLFTITLPLFIKAGYHAIINSIPPDASK